MNLSRYIETITKRTGHGIDLNEGGVLFVQTTNDAAKMAVGYYPIVLKGGEKALKSLKPGLRFSFSYSGSDGVGPKGMVGSATFTIKQFVEIKVAKEQKEVAERLSEIAKTMKPAASVTPKVSTRKLMPEKSPILPGSLRPTKLRLTPRSGFQVTSFLKMERSA